MENEIREIFTSPITVFKFLSITTLWETYGLNLLPELKTVVTDKLRQIQGWENSYKYVLEGILDAIEIVVTQPDKHDTGNYNTLLNSFNWNGKKVFTTSVYTINFGPMDIVNLRLKLVCLDWPDPWKSYILGATIFL